MSIFCEARVKGEVEYTLGEATFYDCKPCGAEAVPVPTGYEGPAICVDCLARQLAGGPDWLGYFDGPTPPDAPTTDSAAFYAALLDVYRESYPGVAASPGTLRSWFQGQLALAEASEKEEQREELKREWIALDEELMSSGASAGNNFGLFYRSIARKMEIEEELKRLSN